MTSVELLAWLGEADIALHRLMTGSRVEEIDSPSGRVRNTNASVGDLESYPISHSLVTTAMWATLVAAIYGAVSRYRRDALVAGAAVVSHWLLDAVAHRPSRGARRHSRFTLSETARAATSTAPRSGPQTEGDR
jgi:membrane-bound metal-dependent hydrolase YbcI (DUF457 family)